MDSVAPRSDCVDVQADLKLDCPYMANITTKQEKDQDKDEQLHIVAVKFNLSSVTLVYLTAVPSEQGANICLLA